MSELQTHLGYGKVGVIEMDTFTRILMGKIYDTEEIRKDSPTDYGNGFEYIGVAPLGSNINDPVWFCVRCTWVDSRKVRYQFREFISWTDRQQGWN